MGAIYVSRLATSCRVQILKSWVKCPKARNEQKWWKANWLRSVCCISVLQGVCSNSTINVAMDLYFPGQPDLGALPQPLPMASGDLFNPNPGPCLICTVCLSSPVSVPWMDPGCIWTAPTSSHISGTASWMNKWHQSCSPFSSSACYRWILKWLALAIKI